MQFCAWPKLTIVTLLFAGLGVAVKGSAISRRLSKEKIAGYEPVFVVTDNNAIDLDQLAIVEAVEKQSEGGFAEARDVYTKGAFSKPYAEVSLSSALTTALPTGSTVTGTAINGHEVTGTVLEDAAVGATMLKIRYFISSVQGDYVECQVGGNPFPRTDGCFNASGAFSINGASLDYLYDPLTDNKNNRTIQSFSTSADPYMREDQDPSTPYNDDFQKFVDYYGTSTYADIWVTAALDGTAATFPGKGNADFSSYGFDARAEAVKKGTAYLHFPQWIMHELEEGLDHCKKGCQEEECNVDEAVAYYTGSLEGPDGSGNGVLMYALADKRCQNFKTCGPNGDSTTGTSKVNLDILHLFNLMKENLEEVNCDEAHENEEDIAAKLFVPLIQGTLRYAWETERDPDADEGDEAEGATFAAAVLPLVAACNPTDADIIYNNMRTGKTSVSFTEVKAAFERNYACMGITCADVGGVYDDTSGVYLSGAEPCGSSSSGSGKNVALAVSLPIAVVVALALFILFLSRCRSRKSREVEFKTTEDEFKTTEDEFKTTEDVPHV